jgi:hypothetical protein
LQQQEHLRGEGTAHRFHADLISGPVNSLRLFMGGARETRRKPGSAAGAGRGAGRGAGVAGIAAYVGDNGCGLAATPEP